MKQEVKIEYDNQQVYFFKHSGKTATQHAHAFIERNKGQIKMKMFMLNVSNIGERWIQVKI